MRGLGPKVKAPAREICLLQVTFQGNVAQQMQSDGAVDLLHNKDITLKAQYAAFIRNSLMPHALLRMLKALLFSLCLYFVSFTMTYLFLQTKGLL